MQLKRNKEMEFETLKKSHKNQIIIGVLAICIIGGALTFNLTRAKYKITESIDLAKGTVNYKIPDMKVVALYIESDNIYTEVNNVPPSGYALNTEKSMCKIYDGTTGIEESPKDNNVTIEYNNGKVDFLGVSKKNTRCYLYFDKYVPPVTIDDIIASTNYKTTTPDFSQVATTDEGVYSVSDPVYGGTSYYWRGAVTNNYVNFANFCWRIVRINGDKTMRLIYDGTTCHANGTSTSESIAKTSVAYNTKASQSNYVGWTYTGTSQRTLSGTTSNIKSETELWYSGAITGANVLKVADGKFCNDRNTGSGYSWSSQPTSTFYYAGYDRSGAKSSSSVSPTLSCPSSDVYTLKVGAITVDEVLFAGGIYGFTNNNAYYLCNGQNDYWTMSPYRWYYGSSSSHSAQVFYVGSNGNIGGGNVSYTYPGIRPVINLRSDITFSGNGTINSPYIVN